jgi:excisionase family DNA binding protein
MNRQRAAAALAELAVAILEDDTAPAAASGPLLTIKETAVELGGAAHPLSPSTVTRMLADGRLSGIGQGKRTRIYRASVDALKNQRRTG